ncbi:hypothetical protein KBD75_02595 [Candidatus Woesebacteria bacterium]|nr:hypothetical protein [Candidatus Woesebacteria bacterium]
MTIKDLYQKYHIMPQLEKHQLRVGAIVALITKDRDSILTALVHDLGNIVKFKNINPEWQSIQERYIAKYGTDANVATIKILEDAGLTKLKQHMEEESDFYKNRMSVTDFSKISLPALLTLYADTRVAFNGVVPMEDRIVDLETRYHMYRDDRIWGPKLEAYIQAMADRDIASLTEADVEPLFDELLTYTI